MANLNQIDSIGNGASYPIRLAQAIDQNGNPEFVVDKDGNKVPKVGWYITKGDPELIKQNLISILTYQIGQRFREEHFGSRTWECLEEPNTSALSLMIKEFIKDGIELWEPRIRALKILVDSNQDSVNILIYFRVSNSADTNELNFQYKLHNLNTYAY